MPTFADQFANEERLTETIFSETKDYFLNERDEILTEEPRLIRLYATGKKISSNSFRSRFIHSAIKLSFVNWQRRL